MRVFPRFASAIFGVAILFGGSVAAASAQADRDDGQAVFVQSNDPDANQVLAYRRARDGTLTPTASFPSGGKGGRLMGAMSDPLGSQGSLRFDAAHDRLIGVNAGSNTVYSFKVEGGRLSGRQVLGSDGIFPVSIAVHNDLVYVLNARGNGSVHGYRLREDGLESIPGSTRSLDLTPNPTPTEFLTTPGQVGFTPDGRHLIVTTKGNGSHIDVFRVDEDGRLSAKPVENPSATPVPFAFTFDPQRQLVVGEAGTSSVTTYTVHEDGSLTSIASASDGQVALCWIAPARGTYFVSNTGSADLSAFRLDAAGHPSLVGTTPVGPGPIDIGVPAGGQFLYVELGGNGTVAELRVGADGSLTPIGTVAGHPGEEGIVAL